MDDFIILHQAEFQLLLLVTPDEWTVLTLLLLPVHGDRSQALFQLLPE